MIQKLGLTLHLLFAKMHKTKPKKKQELWQRDLTRYEQFKINFKVKCRRFDTQTRGMGLTLVILIVAMVVINASPLIFGWVIEQMDKAKYSSALNNACKIQDFYALNFRSCEGIGVRP